MIKLVSLNIERSKHLHRIIPFLRDTRPDVVCLQELVPDDIPSIQRETGLRACHHAAMAVHPDNGRAFGIAVLARTGFLKTELLQYAGGGDGTSPFDRATPESKVQTCRYAVALATMDHEGAHYAFGTTHFPWTPDGLPRPFQDDAADRLIAGLAGRPLVLTGDFNAPRGGAIFGRLAHSWTDWVPPEITTSLDPDLHRAGPLALMVDGAFSTPEFELADVQLHGGLSDHQAISAVVRPVRA